MDDSFDLTEIFKSRPMRGLGDYHLRSALQYVDLSRLSNGSGRWREQKSYNTILSTNKGCTIKPGEPVRLFLELIDYRSYNMSEPIIFIDDLLVLLEAEFKGLSPFRYDNDKFEEALLLMKESHWKGSTYFDLKVAMVRLILFCMSYTSQRDCPDLKCISIKDGIPTFTYGRTTLLLYGELICQRMPDKTCHIYSLDHVRMVCDKITERDNILTATTMGNMLFPDIYPSSLCISHVFRVFDDHLRTKGNLGYSAIKVYEALVTGYLLSQDHSNFWDSERFLTSTLSDLSTSDRLACEEMIRVFNSHCLGPHHLTQLCGLFRSWGHPVIDVLKGMEKVREIGTSKKVIDLWTAKRAGWKFLEIFFTTYFSKDKKYPTFFLSPNSKGSYLSDTLINGEVLNKKHPEYSLSDWETVQVGHIFSIPTSFNLSMIISDTAISPTRTELLRSAKEGSSGLDPVQRRGVLKWMKDGVLDCHRLIQSVNDNPTGLDKDNLLVGLYPKEREQNVKPRMFALMPLVMRSFMVVTEAMLSDNVIDYVPGVTMTQSMLQLQKQMIKLTMQQRSLSGDSMTFCISIDFEKWNLNMRRESTQFVFESLGRLFGMEHIYNRTYDIFVNSIIYLADGSYTLKLSDDLDLMESDINLAYTGHVGGFEGLRQKGWTIFTVSLISAICDDLGISWKLMGQGDNQVLMVTIYSSAAREYTLRSPEVEQEIHKQLGNLLTDLETTFGLVALPLKPLETWISENFFSYGKIPIYKGVPCSVSLKRISRIFFFSNEDLMTLDNAMGAISSNAQAAAMNDIIPIIPYIIAKWQHLQCVKLFMNYHPLVGSKPISVNEAPRFVMFDHDTKRNVTFGSDIRASQRVEDLMMCILPKTLGGYNTLTFFEMISRGFSDPPNRDIQYLWMMYDNIREDELRVAVYNCLCLHLNEKINYTYLLNDPTGLNLFVPVNSSTAIKQMIHRTIESLNFDSQFSSWFQELLSCSKPESILSLCTHLTQNQVLNVRFLHDIVGSTLFGYSDSISSKVDKTVTLSRMALGSEDVVRKLVNNELRFLNYFLWRICEPGNYPIFGTCPSAYLRSARRVGWNKDLIGVDVPYPYHFMSRVQEGINNKDSYVEVLISDLALTDQNTIAESVGSALPYLGSVTKEKVISSPIKAAYGTEPLITRPLRLLRSIGWFVHPDSNFATLLENLVSAVCNIPPQNLIYVPDDVKGSMVHRYSDFATKHGALYLPLYGPGTFLNLSTNHFLEFAKGSKNVTLHFQALLCIIQMSAVSSLFSDNFKKSLRFYKCCEECITPVIDEYPDLNEVVPQEYIPTRPANPYLYMTEDQIPLIVREKIDNMRVLKKVSLDNISYPSLEDNLTIWLALRILGDISSSTDSGSILFDVSSLDRTLFLKIHPDKVIQRIAAFLWMRISGEKKYTTNSFPSWGVVKGDIIRNLERTPSTAFSMYSGYYLWDETIEYLKKMKAEFPSVYPMTPQSLSVASKGTVINFIKKMTEIPRFDIVEKLIFYDYEGDYPSLLRSALITGRDGLPKKCAWCVIKVSELKREDLKKISKLFTVKCKIGHNVLNFADFLDLKYLSSTPISAAFDRIRRLPPLPTEESSCPILVSKWQIDPDIVASHNQITGWSDHEEYYHVPRIRLDSINMFQMNLPYRYPTDSLYGCMVAFAGFKSQKSYKSVIVFGDGYGYSSLAAQATFKQSIIWSWTLIDISEGVPHSSRASLPPAHYHFDHSRIRYDLTFENVTDIRSKDWVCSTAKIMEDKGIDLFISDAELWYTGVENYDSFLMQVYDAKIEQALIKIKARTLEELKAVINVISKRYKCWEIRVSDVDSLSTGSSWVYLNGRLKNVSTSYLNAESMREMLKLVVQTTRGHLREHRTQGEELVLRIKDGLTMNIEFVNYQRSIINSWFCILGLTGWEGQNFTQLYNRIRTGKRPRFVTDLTGSDIYYMRDGDKDALTIRLISLISSFCKSVNLAYRLINESWALKWERKDSGSWTIYLEKTGSRLKDHKTTSLIMRHGRTMREIRTQMIDEVGSSRRNEPLEFTNYNDQIEFKYVPSHEIGTHQVCFLPISKISFYH